MFSDFDFDVIVRSLPYLFYQGMTFTVLLTALATAGGVVLGTLLGFGVRALLHDSCIVAPAYTSKYSTLTSYRCPAVSRTIALFSVSAWRLQLSITSLPSTHSRTPSSEFV